MNKIIKILGPSGAGKTTLVRGLMKSSHTDVLLSCGPPGSKLKNEGYVVYTKPTPTLIVGSYESNCGGVDTLPSAQYTMDTVDEMYHQGNVVFEGLMQSTYYGKMGDWSVKYGQDFIYAWLNTPKSVCMARLHERRQSNGTTRALNVPQAEAKWGSVKTAFDKAKSRGHNCVELRWNEDPVTHLLELLK